MKPLFYLMLPFIIGCSSANKREGSSQYEAQAGRVTITRDSWGVPHIFGKTDADAVFGLMYAQCEESFARVEKNYIEKLGRLSELEGENFLYQDLQMRLLYDTAEAKNDYNRSPSWLKKLLNAFADGIHYYMETHPDVKPLLLERFEPWYPLLFTDGAFIDTQTGGLLFSDMKDLFRESLPPAVSAYNSSSFFQCQPVGSNGFAISGSRSASKNALLYINPHVSFYFRTEVHMVSEEGLNAYGAATWGQFFIFHGFNEHCGWMHTSSAADASDLYEEKVIKKEDNYFYEYDGGLKPMVKRTIPLRYLSGGRIMTSSINAYSSHHGPVVGTRNNKWLALKAQNRSLDGLMQSWLRTKANNLGEFNQVMQMRANSSTNTMYADDEGNIAYWHGNFIPKRNGKYNWALPVDGSVSATEWQGLYSLEEMVNVVNPKEGWMQNCNSSPFNLSGINSIRDMYPPYMAPEGENFRSVYAIKQLSSMENVTADKLVSLGYDHYLSAFDTLLPFLVKDFDALPVMDPLYKNLKEAMDSLRNWDMRSSVSSIATTVGIFWAYQVLSKKIANVPEIISGDQVKLFTLKIKNHSPAERLNALQVVLSGLTNKLGKWKIPWGEINRFQRLDGEIKARFDDGKQSLPVGMGPAVLGSLPSYEAVWHESKMYGTAGNSFVAVVEFVRKGSPGGKRVKAKSIVTGGGSFLPGSKHFLDQAQMYIDGKFKDVFFYKDDIHKNAERTYRPGVK